MPSNLEKPSFDNSMELSSGYKSRKNSPEWNILFDLYEKWQRNKSPSKIPKILHQIWLGGPLPPKLEQYSIEWRKLHPDWEYRLWTDHDVKTMEFNNKPLLDKTNNMGQRSDILRYEILKTHGGVYLDTDFIPLKNLDDLLCTDFFTGVSYDDAPNMFNGLIGTTPNNPIICNLNIINKVDDTDAMTIIDTTGPYHLTRSFFKTYYLVETPVALPVSYFYPYPNFIRDQVKGNDYKKYIKEESYCCHVWNCGWF